MRYSCAHLRAAALAGLLCAVARPAGEPVVPLTVCEVLRDLPAQEGKSMAVLGRYSFREEGHFAGAAGMRAGCRGHALPLAGGRLECGPKPPDSFELDAAAVRRKLADVERHTALGKFRFGTPDYDRWAVVYGRVEPRKPDDGKAAANLVFRGSGVVIFLRPAP